MRKPCIFYEEGQQLGECIFLKEVEGRLRNNGETIRKALFKCSCGNEFITNINFVKRGKTKSCGCRSRGYKHGHAKRREKHPDYSIWAAMLSRCKGLTNQNKKLYKDKGIEVCDRWKESFQNFLEDMGYRPSSEYSIDRIDGNKGYYKENCRWATSKQQANNISRNVIVTYKGETKTLSEWKDIIPIPYYALRSRIRVWGWPVELAFETPVSSSNQKIKSKYLLKQSNCLVEI